MRKTALVGCLVVAAVATLSSACSSTNNATSTTTAGTAAATSMPAPAGSTAAPAGTATRSTPSGTTPDNAIEGLPISAQQKTCLKDKVNSDPSLNAIAQKSAYTKAEATQFVNLMLSCMSRGDLTNVLTANQKDPTSAASRCQASKISQLSEDQIAGLLSQDPATIQSLQADSQQCAALGSSTSTP